jgi:hypothetical protein
VRYFGIEMDEDGIRSLVKQIVDTYESGLHEHGTYQAAVEFVQEVTLNSMENVAESIEEIIEHTGTIH